MTQHDDGQPCECGQDHTAQLRDIEQCVANHVALIDRAAATRHELNHRADTGAMTREESYRARAAMCLELGASAGAIASARGASPDTAGVVAALAGIVSLHEPRWNAAGCRGCDSPEWPCPTMTLATLDARTSEQVEACRAELARRWS